MFTSTFIFTFLSGKLSLPGPSAGSQTNHPFFTRSFSPLSCFSAYLPSGSCSSCSHSFSSAAFPILLFPDNSHVGKPLYCLCPWPCFTFLWSFLIGCHSGSFTLAWPKYHRSFDLFGVIFGVARCWLGFFS